MQISMLGRLSLRRQNPDTATELGVGVGLGVGVVLAIAFALELGWIYALG